MIRIKNITNRLQSISCMGVGAFKPGEERDVSEEQAKRIIGRNDSFEVVEGSVKKYSFSSTENQEDCEGNCEDKPIKKKKKF